MVQVGILGPERISAKKKTAGIIVIPPFLFRSIGSDKFDPERVVTDEDIGVLVLPAEGESDHL